MNNTFKKITGGSEEEAYQKFPWLKNASFKDADIDITNNWLIWKGGIWKGGILKDGTFEGGVWEGGIWKSGVWKGGIWKG